MYTIIGSRAALRHRVIPNRTPKDWDIIATRKGAEEFFDIQNLKQLRVEDTPKGYVAFCKGDSIVEVELTESCNNSAEILERVVEQCGNKSFASPDWLYFLKMSHRYAKDSPHFLKTLVDAQYMHSKGIRMPKNSEEIFKEREKLTYTNKLPKLNVSKESFFKGDSVPYQYEHDDIHRIVSILEKPAYTYYLKEGSEVLTSREKFFSLPEHIRLLGGLEEALVLTAERSLIPNNFTPDPDKMFKYALSKVCTSITGGYFREFCWWNYFKICKIYDKFCKGRWSENLKNEIDKGNLKKYGG